MLTDPVSDYLTRIRNGLTADHREVEIPASRLKQEMTGILKEQGYISRLRGRADHGRRDDPDPAQVHGRTPAWISGLERVSRPGRRRYVTGKRFPRVQGGMGTAIVSTSRGVMSGHEATPQASAARSSPTFGERGT